MGPLCLFIVLFVSVHLIVKMGGCSVYIWIVWMGVCSVLSVYIWIVWMGLVLFCIPKAAPPKIPSVCETNQVTMQRIQQPNRLLLFTLEIIGNN